jgi:hypothetical protein
LIGLPIGRRDAVEQTLVERQQFLSNIRHDVNPVNPNRR